MKNFNQLLVYPETTLREAMSILDRSGMGVLLLVSKQGLFLRTVTDGDLRRLLLAGKELTETIEQLPEINSIVLTEPYSKAIALSTMNKEKVDQLPLLDASGRVVDLIERKFLGQQILLSTPHIGDEEKQYVDEAFRTNWIAPLGPNVDSFEKEICDLTSSSYAAALSSGTAAIHLGLKVLNIEPGDFIFCSSFTFVASANPILYENATPVFIDSERESWNMCPESLRKALEAFAKRGTLPKAVIVVNLYGQSADFDKILAVCNKYDVPIIEDAAESLGANYKGRPSGTLGHLGVFSFNGNKIITTSGGGILVSENKEVIERVKFLSTQAKEDFAHYEHSEVGYNYRMSNILAGVGRGQLKVLEDRVKKRREIFDFYKNELTEICPLEWQPEPEWSYSNRWLSACLIKEDAQVSRYEFAQQMSAELIETRPLWKPMHLQPLFSGTEMFFIEDTPVCEDLFDRGVCLPSGSNLTAEQLEKVVTQIKSVFLATTVTK